MAHPESCAFASVSGRQSAPSRFRPHSRRTGRCSSRCYSRARCYGPGPRRAGGSGGKEMRAPSPQDRRKRPTRLTTCLTQCRCIDSLFRSAERMTASIKRQKAQRSNAMMRLTSYAITIAIHFFTITRLTIIDRCGPGCSCRIASRPIVTGLRRPRSHKPQANTNGLHKLDKPGPSVCRGSYAPRASQNA